MPLSATQVRASELGPVGGRAFNPEHICPTYCVWPQGDAKVLEASSEHKGGGAGGLVLTWVGPGTGDGWTPPLSP